MTTETQLDTALHIIDTACRVLENTQTLMSKADETVTVLTGKLNACYKLLQEMSDGVGPDFAKRIEELLPEQYK